MVIETAAFFLAQYIVSKLLDAGVDYVKDQEQAVGSFQRALGRALAELGRVDTDIRSAVDNDPVWRALGDEVHKLVDVDHSIEPDIEQLVAVFAEYVEKDHHELRDVLSEFLLLARRKLAEETHLLPILAYRTAARAEDMLEKIVPSDDVEEISEKTRHAATKQLSDYRAVRIGGDLHPVELSFELQAHNNDRTPLGFPDVLSALGSGHEIVLIAAPGGGKTTPLIQLADLLLANEVGPVPVILSLPDWLFDPRAIHEHIGAMPDFSGTDAQEIVTLGKAGRIAFLIDGWNEVSPAKLVEARSKIEAIVRDFPLAAIVLASREVSRYPSFPHAEHFKILPLSRAQR